MDTEKAACGRPFFVSGGGGSFFCLRRGAFYFFLPPTGYFLSRKKVTKERFKKRGISIFPFP